MALSHLTDDQIRDWTREQKDRWWLQNVFRGDMPQLTLRAAATGFLLGGVLSATNLYVAAKTGWTLGVGLTSQYLEQFGRKLLGGLLGSLGGSVGRTIGRQAVSSGLTFATTYALGRVAQRYYAGGRQLDAATLKITFTEMLAEAKALAPRYKDEIEQRARSIKPRELAALIRGTGDDAGIAGAS